MLYNEEESSGSDSDSEFAEDMEALRRACTITGVDDSVDDLPKSTTADGDNDSAYESEDEDIELLRRIQQRFSVPTDEFGIENLPISMKPLNIIFPSGLSDDNDDYGADFETLHAIQRRFSQYNDSMNNCMESTLQRSEQVGATNTIDLGKESSPNFFVSNNNNGQGFPDYVDGGTTDQNLDISNISSENLYANVSEGHEPGSELVPVTNGGFPRSAQAFVEAIKKNRTCQKFMRSKLIGIEARLEKTRKLTERVKIMKDFQVACKKKTSRALSQKKDARIQLITIPKQRANASKTTDKSTHAIYQGPLENSQVAYYRKAMSQCPSSLSREPWSKEENENLLKGIKQQFQETLMQNLFSNGDADSCHLDSMIAKIRDREITPEEIKSFLPKVNWEQLASMYIRGRTGPECESRWRNCEDPLINREPWSTNEDNRLLQVMQKLESASWIEIAKELKTNRTPFQCLSRYQRTLNSSIIRNEWTPCEDDELRRAVAEYGETNWQLVASTIEGRTGTQCSNRWKKSLNPLRERVGKWGPDEDKRLKIAVSLFGARNWNKIAKYVTGRTQVQCRERWVNCLDPSLNMNEWTEEEDLKLKAAIAEHGYSWSRIAACIPPRTDSQCRRRWKVLLPDEVPLLQEARKIKRAFYVSNFVDREEERPNLTVEDLIRRPLLIESEPKATEDHITTENKKQRSVRKARSKRARKATHTEKVFGLTDEDDLGEYYGAQNDGHADITTGGEGPTAFHRDNTSDIRKKSSGKSMGKESVHKVRSKRARKATHTENLFELTDEDDMVGNGHADITTNGEGHTECNGDNNSDIRKKTSGKCTGSERHAFKIRSRRARQVTHTEKVLRLIDEDDAEENNDHAVITGVLDQTNGEGSRTFKVENGEVEMKATGKRKQKQRSVLSCKARKVTHTEEVIRLTNEDAMVDNGINADITTNGEQPTACSGDNSEIKIYTSRKRKQRDKKEHEAMEETFEPDATSKKKNMTNETSIITDPFYLSRSSDNPQMNENCCSQDVETPKQLKVYTRRPKGNRNNVTDKSKKGSCVQQLGDEETLGSFFIVLKKRRLGIFD